MNEENNPHLYSKTYDVFLRVPTTERLPNDQKFNEAAEVVLDIADVPFIP